MSIRIENEYMFLEVYGRVAATAVFHQHAAADGHGAWTVSCKPGRLLTRGQAITALTVAELLEHGHAASDPPVVAATVASSNVARKRDASVMRNRLNEAEAALRALKASWGLWADTVRQSVETRHGVAYPVSFEEADKVIINDPGYGAALDLMRSIDEARSAIEQAQAEFERLEDSDERGVHCDGRSHDLGTYRA